MRPELIPYGHISSYAVLMLAGFLSGFLLARARARQSGLEARHVDNISLLLLITGPLGARLISRLFYLPNTTFWSALKVWEGGGLVFYGGLILGVLSAVLYCLLARISAVQILDLFAPSVALGLAFGRVGCFLAGCCWGDVCVSEIDTAQLTSLQRRQIHTIVALSGEGVPFAVRFPQGSDIFRQHRDFGLIGPDSAVSLPVHPVQIYEAGLALALCVALIRLSLRPRFQGEVICALGVGYACIRFPLEF